MGAVINLKKKISGTSRRRLDDYDLVTFWFGCSVGNTTSEGFGHDEGKKHPRRRIIVWALDARDACSLFLSYSSLAVVCGFTQNRCTMYNMKCKGVGKLSTAAAGYNGSRHVHLENILPCIEGTARAHIYRVHTLWARLPSPKRDPNNNLCMLYTKYCVVSRARQQFLFLFCSTQNMELTECVCSRHATS